MNSSDLNSIRNQLMAFQNGSEPDLQDEAPVWEKPRSPSLPFPDQSRGYPQQPDQAELIQALRQRSAMATPRQPTPEELAATASPLPGSVSSALRRLHEEADRINDLYRQQEAAIQNFQRTVKGLDIILMRQGDGNGTRSEQFCELREAALTVVQQDETGRYILSAVDIDLTIDEQQAYQDAAEIRSLGRSRSRPPKRPDLLSSLLAEPMSAIAGVWNSLTSTLETRTQITALDILMWFGGGLIARKALQLLVAAIPALGHWVLGIIIAAVILGLYRLLFGNQTDLAFIARLFMALVGLGVGGQI